MSTQDETQVHTADATLGGAPPSPDPAEAITLQSKGRQPPRAAALPGLYEDRTFWGMTFTQFFGAFNDNLYKQLLLLISVTALSAGAAAEEATGAAGGGEDRQAIAMLVFSTPFLLLSGFAGVVSDRLSKRTVIVGAKLAETLIMLAGVAGFALLANHGEAGYAFLLVVLFFMGAQSAMFTPAKYGVLPELFRRSDLPRANGVFLMTTFLAIIFGTALAGPLIDIFGEGNLWIGSIFCVAIGLVGTVTSLLVRRVDAAHPNLPMRPREVVIPKEMRILLRTDRRLLMAIVVSSMFWLIAGLVHPTVNALGRFQLRLSSASLISSLAASIGVGIALGCLLAGAVSRRRINFTITRIGAVGILVCLGLLSLPGLDGKRPHLLGFYGSLPTLIALGVFTGMFTVPIQVFLQARPPDGQKGRLIAVMNQANWVAIWLSAFVYMGFDLLRDALDWPRSSMFALTALIMLPVVLFYHPESEDLEELEQTVEQDAG